MQRNWEIVGLTVVDGRYEVVTRVNGVDRSSGFQPSHFGDWGLSRRELAILRKGMTKGGRDRRPPRN